MHGWYLDTEVNSRCKSAVSLTIVVTYMCTCVDIISRRLVHVLAFLAICTYVYIRRSSHFHNYGCNLDIQYIQIH